MANETYYYTWDFSLDQFKDMLKAIITADDTLGDCYGFLHCGNLCVDFMLKESSKGGLYVDPCVYILHRDTGYGYTKKDQIPYDFFDEDAPTVPTIDLKNGRSIEEAYNNFKLSFIRHFHLFIDAYNLEDEARSENGWDTVKE